MIFCGKRKIIRFVLTCYFPYTINRQTVERQPASPPSATSRLHTAWVPKGTQIGIQQKVKLIFVYKVLKHYCNTYKQRSALGGDSRGKDGEETRSKLLHCSLLRSIAGHSKCCKNELGAVRDESEKLKVLSERIFSN